MPEFTRLLIRLMVCSLFVPHFQTVLIANSPNSAALRILTNAVSAESVPTVDEDSDTVISDSVISAAPTSRKSTDAQHSELQFETLVNMLTAEEFSRRQQASLELLELGEKAIPQLLDAIQSENPELQDRATVLVRLIRERLFRSKLIAAADHQPATAAALPEWQRFSSIVGTSSDDIQLFLKLQRTEPQLFTAALFEPSGLSAVLERRCAELAAAYNGQPDQAFPETSYMGVLLLGSNPSVRLRGATSSSISSALADPRLIKASTDGPSDDVLRKLLGEWILRPGIATERPLLFAMETHHPAGKVLAERIIRSHSRRPEMLWALLTMAALGSDEDLPLLEAELANETVLWPPRGVAGGPQDAAVPPNNAAPKKQPDENHSQSRGYRVQTRDAALAVAIHLRKKRPEDFGFRVRRSDVTVFARESLGFSSATDREDAFASYRNLVNQKP
jgi:hypothetical protein